MAWPPQTHQDVQDAVTARAVIADINTTGTPTGDALRAAYANPLRLRAQSVLERLSPDAAPFAALTADAPTVTVTSSATLPGRLIGAQGGEITEVGSRGDWNDSAGRLAVGGLSGLDFYHTGTACEFQIYVGTAAAYPAWIFIDGQPVARTPSNVDMSAANMVYVKFTFASSRRRRIEFICTHSGNWYGVRGAMQDTFEPAPRRPVVAWVGDSFWGGSNGTPGIQASAFFAARQLGVECLTYELAFAGTGYVSPASFEVFGGPTHLSQLTRAQPDLIVVQGSVNDDGGSGIQSAAAAAYASWRSALPDTPVIVLGPQPNAASATLGAPRQANIAAVKAAAVSAPNVIGFHDQVGTAGGVPSAWDPTPQVPDGTLVTRYGSVWRLANGGKIDWGGGGPASDPAWALQTWLVYGTGTVGSTTGDGNRDTLVYSDGTHPTVPASEAYGLIIARKIRHDLRDYARTGAVTVD